MTRKAQTTQRKLLGIYSDEHHQAVFIDTPGLLEPRYMLHRSMREEALSSLEDADVAVAVVDVGFQPSIDWIASFAPSIRCAKLLCFNKTDRSTPAELERLAALWEPTTWAGIHPTVAVKGTGVEALRGGILELLPESPPLYPTDELSNAPVRDFISEMIRETCLEELDDEVPYAIAVQIEQFKKRKGGQPTYIEAIVFVERESQKGIVVGAGGKTIRKIGTRSRGKIEPFLDHRVYLELRVKVLANWRRKTDKLRLLGFRVPAEEK